MRSSSIISSSAGSQLIAWRVGAVAFQVSFISRTLTMSLAENSQRPSIEDMTACYSAETVFNSVASGYAAGIAGVLVGHPMDSAKVWLQTKGMAPATGSATSSATTITTNVANNVLTGLNPPRAPLLMNATAGNNMSTLAAPAPQERGFNLRSIRALYSGVTGPLLTVGMIQSINFAIYDSLRRILHRQSHPHASDSDYLHNDSLTNVSVSAMVAGSVLALCTSPLLVVKTKQQIMEWNFQRAVRETLQSSNKTWRKRLYAGFGPHCIAEVWGRGIYFCTYEITKRTFLENKQQPNATVSLQERCVSAALAGIVCWSLIFPFDALRSRMYAQELSNHAVPKSTWQMAKSMYRETNSLRPFYRGFGVTVLRAGPVAAAVLPIYDTTLEWLSQDDL
jgi:solute carrier family 25 carnitine/acylcarnitine transporter 20/29